MRRDHHKDIHKSLLCGREKGQRYHPRLINGQLLDPNLSINQQHWGCFNKYVNIKSGKRKIRSKKASPFHKVNDIDLL